LGLFLLGGSSAVWASLRAEIDRQTVSAGDTLTLTIESDRAQSQQSPDLSPLRRDFDVLGTSTNSETSIVNGNRSDSTRWVVQLQPRRSGTIDIPPITVGNEHTIAIPLNVTAASPQQAQQTSAHAFLEVESDAAGKSIYVQQQIPYTVRLFYDDTVQTGDLAAPAPQNAIVEQLGKEDRYTAVRNGRSYNVIERHYAIAPERSGALAIPPASFRGTMLVAPNAQGDAAAADDPWSRLLRGTPFANDPFFRGGFAAGMSLGATTRPVDIHSQEIDLNVQPLPAGVHGNWLPAEQVTLHDSWDDNPPQFKVGEPVTRTITVNAKGLAASQIPPLTFSAPANARLYPEASSNQSRTDGKVIYGISKQSVTYIPTAQGTLNIPSIELAWWNTRSNTQSSAALPAQEFTVKPGASAAQSNAAAPAPAPAPAPAGTPPQAKAATTPVAAVQPPQGASSGARLQRHLTWFASGIGLLLIAVVAAVALRRRRNNASKPAAPAAAANPLVQRKAAMRALQLACAANDSRAAAAALADLARAEWPDDPPRGLGALAARLETGANEVIALDRCLYGAGGSAWEGSALWAAIGNGFKPRRGDNLRNDDGLGALYP